MLHQQESNFTRILLRKLSPSLCRSWVFRPVPLELFLSTHEIVSFQCSYCTFPCNSKAQICRAKDESDKAAIGKEWRSFVGMAIVGYLGRKNNPTIF